VLTVPPVGVSFLLTSVNSPPGDVIVYIRDHGCKLAEDGGSPQVIVFERLINKYLIP
jgi:hypothetical protein